MGDAKTAHAQIKELLKIAKSERVNIPEAAMKKITAKFGGNKHELPAEMPQSNKKSKRGGENGGGESEPVTAGYAALSKDGSGEDFNEGEEEPMAPHKTAPVRLVDDVRQKKANIAANQKLVDAIIRDHDGAITSAKAALAVPMVGDKISAQMGKVLATGKLEDQTGGQSAVGEGHADSAVDEGHADSAVDESHADSTVGEGHADSAADK
ncbi:hypothetical protein PF010_g29063 [Phytophthora fragariae]|uniref:Uncharacterized protein n=1 Tax=Phytophthora fragariae TaxID=53985 RepID=A0A6A3H6U8_9STRA|nr:hypothetical protein PF011_g28563 [Phytophthora fragariae]KAE9063278.1 hypothetical protein PF010_g29063 [Phytophthora fragariae]KAE9168710.1 hypothetical protein PF004_g28419 [Phytophthora fragariae]